MKKSTEKKLKKENMIKKNKNHSLEKKQESEIPRIVAGYVIIARKIMDSAIWQDDPEMLKLFIYLICKGRHKNEAKKFPNGVEVKRGELLTSYKIIISDNEYIYQGAVKNWSKGKLHRMLEQLEKNGSIERLQDTHGTHIRVVHYDKYQNPENYKNRDSGTKPNGTGTKVKRSQTITGTNNKEKNVNNAKKEKNITKNSERVSSNKKLKNSNSSYEKNDPSTSIEDEGTPWSDEKFIKFDYELSKAVLEYQYERFPKLVDKSEDSIRRGADTIRLMREQDGFSEEEILKSIWFGIKDSDFWHDKILSVANLRKKSKINNKTKIQNIYRDWMAAKEKGKNKKKEKTTREIMKEAMDE